MRRVSFHRFAERELNGLAAAKIHPMRLVAARPPKKPHDRKNRPHELVSTPRFRKTAHEQKNVRTTHKNAVFGHFRLALDEKKLFMEENICLWEKTFVFGKKLLFMEENICTRHRFLGFAAQLRDMPHFEGGSPTNLVNFLRFIVETEAHSLYKYVPE